MGKDTKNPFTKLLADTPHKLLKMKLNVTRQALHNWHHGYALPSKGSIEVIVKLFPNITEQDIYNHYNTKQGKEKKDAGRKEGSPRQGRPKANAGSKKD